METATLVIRVLYGVFVVIGLFWILTGAYTFFQSRKIQDKRGVDEGIEGILYGGVISIIAPVIGESIIVAITNLAV